MAAGMRPLTKKEKERRKREAHEERAKHGSLFKQLLFSLAIAILTLFRGTIIVSLGVGRAAGIRPG